jgi:hypothetical protein
MGFMAPLMGILGAGASLLGGGGAAAGAGSLIADAAAAPMTGALGGGLGSLGGSALGGLGLDRLGSLLSKVQQGVSLGSSLGQLVSGGQQPQPQEAPIGPMPQMEQPPPVAPMPSSSVPMGGGMNYTPTAAMFNPSTNRNYPMRLSSLR